jgi:Fe-S cluster biogenesis protein NfuA
LKLVLDRPLDRSGAPERRFGSPEEAHGLPVVEALLTVPGVAEVTVAGNSLTVSKAPEENWDDLEDRIRYALETVLAVSDEAAAGAGMPEEASISDDDIYGLVEDIFRTRLNPQIASHGGKVELLDVQDGVVVLRMMGGCQGCGMAAVTLRQGIEKTLRAMVPGFRGIADITDHSSGSNPYYK